MAGFKTHITVSTALGLAGGAAAYAGFGVPLDQCLLGAGLCSVSGMLPDIDSDSGVPLRESLAFGAAVVPMLLVDRLRQMGLSTDGIVLVASGIYLAIRFGFGKFLKQYTVHRGMFHSIPAAIIFAELAFLMCDCPQTSHRLFKAGAVLAGFMSHLVLDEIWAIDLRRGRVKKSFGTAVKLFSSSHWANVSTYGKLILLTMLCVGEPTLMKALGIEHVHVNSAQGDSAPGESGKHGDSNHDAPKAATSPTKNVTR
ncbi:MAG: metal-dependent hydrolase [Planctomycetia bacterium]|nr:metal-dependent hydrolase [Planctomycetia bacterium]